MGFYDPANEKDAGGVGFVCDIRADPAIEYCRMPCHELLHGVSGRCGLRDQYRRWRRHYDRYAPRFLKATAKDLFGVSCPGPASTGLVIYFYPPIPPSAVQGHYRADHRRYRSNAYRLARTANQCRPRRRGQGSQAAMPAFEQLFVGKGAIGGMENESFERKLYAIRKHKKFSSGSRRREYRTIAPFLHVLFVDQRHYL